MKTNQDYKNSALEALKGNWPATVVATIIYAAIVMVCTAPSSLSGNDLSSVISPAVALAMGGGSFILVILVSVPVQVGYCNSFRKLHQEGDASVVGNMFSLGFNNWGHIVLGQLLMSVFVFLWSLLLIVPGIVKAYAYAMTPYILVERPELSANEAISLSSRMMKGHKFDLFYFQLSFLGWALLGILTLGIGFLWLSPYYMTAQAAFYQDVKAEYESKSAASVQ